MEKFFNFIIKLRWLIILTVTGLTVFFAYQIQNLYINSDVLSSLPDDDGTALLYKDIGMKYGGNDIGMIVLETDNIYKAEVFEHIRQITDSLRITDGISTVTSLTNILDIKSSEWGIEIGNLVDEYDLPDEQTEIDSLKDYIHSKDMYEGTVVSKDGTATVILFTLLDDADKQATAKTVKALVEELKLPEKVYYGGLPFMLNDISQLIVSDMLWLIPIVFVVIAFILLISFKSIRGMLMPLLTAGITVIWTLGIMAYLDYEITIISNIMPVVLLAIGSAYTIHVLNSININETKDRKQALINAMSHTTVPVFLASVTTAIGFVSFIFGAYLTMIKDFGIATAVGILIALLLSIFFVPSIISALSLYKRKALKEKTQNKNYIADKILQSLTNILFKRPKQVLIIWGALIIISIGGIYLIKTSVNITDYFKKDNPTRISENLMQRKFGGSLPVFVEFIGDVQEPEVLKLMIKTEEYMKADTNITSAQSVADLIEQMNDAMGEGEKIPDEKAKIEQLWFLLEGQDVMNQLVSDDLDKGIIQSKFATIETQAIQDFTDKMNGFVEENSSDSIKIKFTGIPPLYVKLNDSLVESQYTSLIIAVLMVLFIVGLLMRSVSKGIYATIPIIATILILLGFMGIAGISLDIATVMVGSIALGIGIDYSIHVVTGYNSYLKESGDVETAVRNTIMSKGKAVIINVFSVSAGFLLLLFAGLLPIKNFGLLIAISMLGSGLGALTLLPVILILANRNNKRKKINNNNKN